MAEPSAAAAAASGGGGDDNNGGKKDPWIIPVGCHFEPTDDELLDYLKNKVLALGLHNFPDVIPTIDVFGTSPDQLPFGKSGKGEKCFSFTTKPHHNLVTGDGYWSPVMEVEVRVNGRLDGFKKEYIFYRGMECPGERTDWCMHEYSLNPKAYAEAAADNDVKLKISNLGVCKIFRKEVPKRSKRQKGRKKW